MRQRLLLFLCLLLPPHWVIGTPQPIHCRTTHSHALLKTQASAVHYRHLVYQSAKHYHLDPRLILAIIEVESNFNPRAVGSQNSIAAYNGGQGNLLKTFSPHPQQAIHVINQLTPDRFYQRVIQHHPLTHTRAYLAKVTRSHSQY